MNESNKTRRWQRSEKFQLSELGETAAKAYLDGIVASRSEEGRQSFDEARARWAAEHSVAEHNVAAEDGLSLRELVNAPLTLAELTQALDGYGPDAKAVKAGLIRLLDAGLVAPVVAATPPEPPSRAW